MGVVDDRIAARAGQRAGLLEGFGRLDGQAFGSNHGCIWIVADTGSNVCAGQKCRFGREKKRNVAQNRSMKTRSEEHTSELQSRLHLVCRLLLEKKKKETLASEILEDKYTVSGSDG